MAIFEYAAYDGQGNRSEGRVEALDEAQAQEKIRALGLTPVEVGQKREGDPYSLKSIRYALFKTAPLAEVEYFISELSLLLNNGIRLNRALEMVSKNIAHPHLKAAVRDIYEQIRRGDSLHKAMKGYPQYFDRMVLNLVDLGENTGKLGELFQEISDHMKFRAQLRGKVVQSLTYPGFIMGVCTLCLLFLFYFVVPRFAVLFAKMEAIPLYTKVLLVTSDFVTRYLVLLVLGLALGLVSFFKVTGRSEFSKVRDRFVLFVPIMRAFTENAERLRFAKSMAILLRNQIQLDRSLVLAVSFVNNELIRARLSPMVQVVKGGGSCAAALQGVRFFPPFFLNLVEIGEETGNMAGVFGEITKELEKKFDISLQRLITFIEPVAIIFMALLVGSIIITIMLSIITTYDIQF